MTVQDLIDYLRARAALPEPLSETVITRTVLLAYDLGLEAGTREAREARPALEPHPGAVPARKEEDTP